MYKPVVVSEAKRNLLLPLVKANPPPWLPILEELLNLANIDACVKNAKFHPRANTILPVVSCGKKHLYAEDDDQMKDVNRNVRKILDTTTFG